MNEIHKIIELIQESNTIAILYHINADGDAIGSSLALQLAFSANEKVIDVIGEEEILKGYKFLPQSNKIIVGLNNKEPYDLAIALDLGELKRLGTRNEIYTNAKHRVNIDHHMHNSLESDAKFVVEDAAASGELVYKIIKEADIKITKEIATCLFTAISTDCGSFKFSNTTSGTHRIAAELIDCGANSAEIAKDVYDNVSFAKQKLLGEVLSLMELHFDGRVTFLESSVEMIKKHGIKSDELENIGNFGVSVEGVELSVFFKEVEPNQIKLSLRSKNYFDCAEFARNFGGGGHARAAGCTLNMPLEDAKKIILDNVNLDKKYETTN